MEAEQELGFTPGNSQPRMNLTTSGILGDQIELFRGQPRLSRRVRGSDREDKVGMQWAAWT